MTTEIKGCGKSAKFRPELICGKTIVKFNPITAEYNYIYLCSECKEKNNSQEMIDNISSDSSPSDKKLIEEIRKNYVSFGNDLREDSMILLAIQKAREDERKRILRIAGRLTNIANGHLSFERLIEEINKK